MCVCVCVCGCVCVVCEGRCVRRQEEASTSSDECSLSDGLLSIHHDNTISWFSPAAQGCLSSDSAGQRASSLGRLSERPGP